MTVITPKTLGIGTCPTCGATAPVKVNRKGRLYLVCPPEADGGCNSQFFGRSARSDKELARRIARWYDPADRKTYLGDAAPAPAPEPPPKAAPKAPADPDPEPTPEPQPAEKPLSFWDRPLF